MKTPFEHRPPPGQGNWAYIPIPYFIPHHLYNNLFLSPATTHLQPGISGNFPFPGTGPYQDLNAAQSLSTTSSAVSASSSVAHLENAGNVAAIARGRLTRQATDSKPTAVGGDGGSKKRKKDSGADDVKVTTTTTNEKDTEAEETAAAAEVEAVTATTAQQEITESTTDAVNKLPSAGLDSGITSLAGGDPAATTPQSFEVGEWEYLGNGTVTPTVNNTDDLKSNQTSSYYRRIVQAFDPDKVSFTTWYPEAEALKLQDLPGSSTTARPFVVAYPFRPSEEYNGNSLFRPVVGPAAAPQQLFSGQAVGLEPPVLPNYY